MYRKVSGYLEKWLSSDRALLVTGARQVGKTYIIREFLKSSGVDFVEFNLIENSLVREAVEVSNNSKELLFRLSALSNKPLKKGETIIFFDEVQASSNILTVIKFLVENKNYKYILSGSLLGVELKSIESIPVGYMDVLKMYPLDFEEFLIANGVSESVISELRQCYIELKPIDNVVHKKMIDLFHLYLVVGGMPAVVDAYIKTNNLKEVVEYQNFINRLYKLDIAKYDVKNKLYLDEIYNLIPSELNNQNKRFILKDVNKNLKFQKYENSFLWLKNAGVALPTYCVDEPKEPLVLSKSRNLFKLFLSDVGLLSSMYMNNMQLRILNKEKDINFGAVYENFVAQELTSKGFDLFYYKSNKFGELDFVVECDGVIPIEVKSGKVYKRHNALDNVLGVYSEIKRAFILSNENLSVEDNKIYLPIYCIMFMQKQELEDMFYRVDIEDLV